MRYDYRYIDINNTFKTSSQVLAQNIYYIIFKLFKVMANCVDTLEAVVSLLFLLIN
jgi:hypothetical protein